MRQGTKRTVAETLIGVDMLRIGIVGAENSHTAAVARICNVKKKVPARVTMVWGETSRSARLTAEAGQIPSVVTDWRDMLGKIDGVMIDHRHPGPHAEVAKFFVKHAVPLFVDKPITHTVVEGRKLCAAAKKMGVPITSFSIIPLQKSFRTFKKSLLEMGDIASLTSTGPADVKSKWAGVYFYGIHQVDAILELVGTGIHAVELKQHRRNAVGILYGKAGPIVTMHCMASGYRGFHWSAVADEKILDFSLEMDSDPYLAGVKMFIDMFRTGREPIDHRRMLAPIAVLAALQRSLNTGGRRVPVRRV